MRVKLNSSYIHPGTQGWMFRGVKHESDSESFASMVEQRLVSRGKHPTIRIRHTNETSIILVSTKHEAIM